MCVHIRYPCPGERAGCTAERAGDPLVLTGGMAGAWASPHPLVAAGLPPGPGSLSAASWCVPGAVQPGDPIRSR